MSKTELKLDWCSYDAAKYAVEKWHYSRSMPTPPVLRIGVWENEIFVGALIFSRGSNNNLLKPYGLKTTEGCELTRVALSRHDNYVSRFIAIAIKMLRKSQPGIRLIVSYADPNKQHVGSIYQAGNWIYTGQTPSDAQYIDKTGRTWHSRQVSSTGVKRQYGEARLVPKPSECIVVPLEGKHRYLYPLDSAMREQIAPLAKPYPKKS